MSDEAEQKVEETHEPGSDLQPADSGGVDAFGRWLRRERELRGLPREEVVRLTKLAPGVIEALESGEPERMPPRAYLMGYLRNYATAVGLDPDDLVLRWQEIEGSGNVPAETSAAAPGRGRWGLVALAVGLALIVAAGVVLALTRWK